MRALSCIVLCVLLGVPVVGHIHQREPERAPGTCYLLSWILWCVLHCMLSSLLR